jgi:hypothetical protein
MINSFYLEFTSKLRFKNFVSKLNRVNNQGKFLWLFIIFMICYSCEKSSIESEDIFFDLQGENGFVGTVDGTDAYVSILLGSDEGIVYVCNGDEDISEWYYGPVSNLNDISFTNPQGAKITASLIGNSFKGEITLRDGRKLSFHAGVNRGIYGGIYKVIDEKAVQAEITASWIIRSEEDQRGFIRSKSTRLQTIRLGKNKLKEISDGTSNTIVIKETSFSIFRYKVVKKPSPGGPIAIPYPIVVYPLPKPGK